MVIFRFLFMSDFRFFILFRPEPKKCLFFVCFTQFVKKIVAWKSLAEGLRHWWEWVCVNTSQSLIKNDYHDCVQNWKVCYNQKLNKINFLVVLGTSFFLLSLIRRNYWVEINLKSIYNLMISKVHVFNFK